MVNDLYSMLGDFALRIMPDPVWIVFFVVVAFGYMIWKNGLSQSSAIPILLVLTFILDVSLNDPANTIHKMFALAAIAQGTIIGLGILSFTGGSFEQTK